MNPTAASDLILAWNAADPVAQPCVLGEALISRYGHRSTVIEVRAHPAGAWMLRLQDAARPDHREWVTHVRTATGGRRLVAPDEAWLRQPDDIAGIAGAAVGSALAESNACSFHECVPVTMGQTVWSGYRDEVAERWTIVGIFHDWLALLGADGNQVVRAAQSTRIMEDPRGAVVMPEDLVHRLAALDEEHASAAEAAEARISAAFASFLAVPGNSTSWRAILDLQRTVAAMRQEVDWVDDRRLIDSNDLTWSAVWGDATVEISLDATTGFATVDMSGAHVGAPVERLLAVHADDAAAWSAILADIDAHRAETVKTTRSRLAETWKRWQSAELPPAAAAIRAALGKRPADLAAAVAQVQAAIDAATQAHRAAANDHVRAILSGVIPLADRDIDMVAKADCEGRGIITAMTSSWIVRIFADGTAGALAQSDDAYDRCACGTISSTGYRSLCSPNEEGETAEDALDHLHAEFLAERAKQKDPIVAARRTYASWYKGLSKSDRQRAGVPAAPGVADDPHAIMAAGRVRLDVANMREVLAAIDAGRALVGQAEVSREAVVAWLDQPAQRLTTHREPQLREELERLASILRGRVEQTWTIAVGDRTVPVLDLVRGQRSHHGNAYGYLHHCDAMRVNDRFFWVTERVLARCPDPDSRLRDIAALLAGTEDEAVRMAWNEQRAHDSSEGASEDDVDQDGDDDEADDDDADGEEEEAIAVSTPRRARAPKQTARASAAPAPRQLSFLGEETAVATASAATDGPVQLTWF